MARVQLMFTARDKFAITNLHNMFQDVGLDLHGNEKGNACRDVCRALRKAAEVLGLGMEFAVCADWEPPVDTGLDVADHGKEGAK